ncbi:MAG: hypothetical protein D6678_06055 [Zetaproteobacteria bacterium]|nr:MAG: hypothetical protein D6678_06055 [Zetaproteobacteria bacterium]
MPYVHVRTNVHVDKPEAFLRACSAHVAEALGKPERYVMVSLQDALPMLFAADGAPCAYVELKSLGLSTAETAELSRGLCALLRQALGVDEARVYIEFAAPERAMFGWNGGTF